MSPFNPLASSESLVRAAPVETGGYVILDTLAQTITTVPSDGRPVRTESYQDFWSEVVRFAPLGRAACAIGAGPEDLGVIY